MGAGYVLLGLTDRVALLVLVATLVAFGHGVLRPTLTSLLSQSANPSEQGIVLGLSQSLTSIAQVLAPPLGGWLIGLGHLSAWAFVAAVASALGWLAAGWGSSRALVVTAQVRADANR
jgi:MFS family permease